MAMARISSKLVLALLALAVAVMGLAVLGRMADALPSLERPLQQSVVLEPPYWLSGQHTTIRDGLVINPHAKKHNAETLDAWLLYDLLLAQQCTASRRYCQSGGAELYLCATGTGQIGGLIVRGSEILSGYVGSDRYWHGKVLDEWSACDGREYR